MPNYNYIPQDILDMQEVLPVDYQQWLDEQEPDTSDRDKATEAFIAESYVKQIREANVLISILADKIPF